MTKRRHIYWTIMALLIGGQYSIAEERTKLNIVEFVDTCVPIWTYYSSVLTAPCTVNVYHYTTANWTFFTRSHIEGSDCSKNSVSSAIREAKFRFILLIDITTFFFIAVIISHVLHQCMPLFKAVFNITRSASVFIV
uniref:Uncharacterized protein n=1 Tax=Amblyomma parvum TaxID=251391 RepID=A0A023G2Q5_AMBPA